MPPEFKRRIVNIPGAKFLQQMALHQFPLAGGENGAWESMYFHSPDHFVGVAGLTPKGKIILVSMFRFPTESRSVELPGATFFGQDSFEKIALIGFQRETGYVPKRISPLTAGFMLSSGTNARFHLFLAEGCVQRTLPALDPVEKAAEFTAFEKDLGKVVDEIAQGNTAYSPFISHALVALLKKGLIGP